MYNQWFKVNKKLSFFNWLNFFQNEFNISIFTVLLQAIGVFKNVEIFFLE